MDKSNFIKYFNGELSQESEKALLDWIDESEDNRKEFLRERELWDMILLNTDEFQNRAFLDSDIRKQKNTSKRWIFETAKIAALVILSLGIGVLAAKYLMPKEEQLAMNSTLEVPIGQRACLTLPDGTKVWLNAKSKLTFPERFSKDNRTVQLDGEAMFDVSHNERAPFMVKTDKYLVKVLGTKFNVNAYKASSMFEATLVRGKVALNKNNSNKEATILKPNEQLIYNADSDQASVKEVSTKYYTSWIDGVYSFDDQPFSAIVQRLERYYEVKIEVRYPELLDYRFTGKFRYSNPITVILDVIKANKKFRYTKVDNRIIIYK